MRDLVPPTATITAPLESSPAIVRIVAQLADNRYVARAEVWFDGERVADRVIEQSGVAPISASAVASRPGPHAVEVRVFDGAGNEGTARTMVDVVAQFEVYHPKIEAGVVYDGVSGPLRYNHDAAVAWFDGRWHALWNANEAPSEHAPGGQYLYASTSVDFVHWTAPTAVFIDPTTTVSPVPSSAASSKQWQPGLLVTDHELWAVWSEGKHSASRGVWHSVLPKATVADPQPRWTSRRLNFSGPVATTVAPGQPATPDVKLGSVGWRFFPTQNLLALSSGRVLAPGMLIDLSCASRPGISSCGFQTQPKFATVLYTDDGGTSWAAGCESGPSPLVCGTTFPDAPESPWEPTVIELDDGTVRMLVRNLDLEDAATEMLFYADSHDGGQTWGALTPVGIETASSRMHALRAAGRFIMVHNDHRVGPGQTDPPEVAARRQVAMFFSPNGDAGEWLSGNNLTGDQLNVSYPQMFEHDGAMHVIYTQGRTVQRIRTARVAPLPATDRSYIFPRTVAEDPRLRLVPDRSFGQSFAFTTTQHVDTLATETRGELGAGFWVRVEGGPFRHALLDTDSDRDRDPLAPKGMIFGLTLNGEGSGYIPFLFTYVGADNGSRFPDGLIRGDAKVPVTNIAFSDNGLGGVRGLAPQHGLATGDRLAISGCSAVYANQTWTITRIDADRFDLDAAVWSTFAGADVTCNGVPQGDAGSYWWSGTSAPPPIVRPGEWTYVGFSRRPKGSGQEVRLRVGTWTSNPSFESRPIVPSTRPMRIGRPSYTGPVIAASGGERDPRGASSGFAGEMARAWIAPRDVPSSEHDVWYGLGARALGLTFNASTAAVAPDVLELEPSALDSAEWNRNFAALPTEWHGVDLLNTSSVPVGPGAPVALMRVRGEGSLGLEIEPFAANEMTTVDLRLKVETPPGLDQEMVLATLSGGHDPIRLALRTVSSGMALVLRRGADESTVGLPPACETAECDYRIEFHAHDVVARAGGRTVALSAPRIEPRVYLGSGYREGRWSPATSFVVPVVSVRSRTTQGWAPGG